MDNVLSVGWLDKKYKYTTGHVDSYLTEKLLLLMFEHKQVIVNQTRGLHLCDMCVGRSVDRVVAAHYKERRIYLGTAQIWLPAQNNQILAAPTLIYHYIQKHDYLPPPIFLDALSEYQPNFDWNGQAIYDKLYKESCAR